MQGDGVVLLDTFVDGAARLLHESLAKDEDTFEDGECPESVRCFIKNLQISRKIWGEHGCTAPGCPCCTYRHSVLSKFMKEIMTDDLESEESADWDSTDSDSEGVVPGTYTPPPPPPEETRPEVCKPA